MATETHKKTPLSKPKRGIRFKPEPGTSAKVEFQRANGQWTIPINALVINESVNGTCLVTIDNGNTSNRDFCRVTVGNLPTTLAEIRWKVSLDGDVIKLGLLYKNT